MPNESRSDYWEWTFSGEAPNYRYLVPGVLKELSKLAAKRVLDIGCGNGSLTARVSQGGYDATGIDFTPSGIERARSSYPGINFQAHDINDPLPENLRSCFDVVLSAEVIEHLFLPREVFARAREALGESGHIVITTPYHGYWKNLGLALLGKFDDHWKSRDDYGHIKFFSPNTLGELMSECGFEPIGITRIGRIPPLAASMVMIGRLRAQ